MARRTGPLREVPAEESVLTGEPAGAAQARPRADVARVPTWISESLVMVQAPAGIGASIPRKEDDRFLRGRGQFVGDLRFPGMQDVAFVRSPVAHARIRAVEIPDEVRGSVFTASDLAEVKPIRAATALRNFKHSSEPILASEKVRYVGEIIAMCVAASRAEAEDIAALVSVDFEEMPAVSDMLAARQPDSPL